MFRCLVLKISTPGENGYSFQGLATCGISSAAEVQGYYMYNNNIISKFLMANLATVVENLTPELHVCTCTCTTPVAMAE